MVNDSMVTSITALETYAVVGSAYRESSQGSAVDGTLTGLSDACFAYVTVRPNVTIERIRIIDKTTGVPRRTLRA